MNVKLNGERQAIDSSTLAELIEKLGLHERRVATLVNGLLVKREQRAATVLAEGDQIEIITMVGGG